MDDARDQTPDTADAAAETETAETETAADLSALEALVGDWLPLPDVAERLGIPFKAVRRLVEDRELLAPLIGDRRIASVPAAFLTDPDEGGRSEVVGHLRGTFVVLTDGGMTDVELIGWLFTPDESLPGRPVDLLRAGQKTEVRRRAMETAW